MNAPINVLIAESDPKKLKKYASLSLWKELGFSVIKTVSNTRDALCAIAENSCSLLITVSRPPEVDARTILKARGDAAAIVIVPRKEGESVGRYFALGACDVIAEPPSRTRLRQALMKAHRIVCRGTSSDEYRRAAEKALASLNVTSESFALKLRDFIAKSEGETATTGSAAEFFSFNRDYFGKLFKQETGMTFNSFYNSFRIEYAKELLSAGGLRVREISEVLGFSSVDHFTALFRRHTGVTPSKYRTDAPK